MNRYLFLFCILIISCQESQPPTTSMETMRSKQLIWWNTIYKYEDMINSSDNPLDREYKISLYKRSMKKFLSSDSNKVMDNWTARLRYFYRISDSLYEIKLQGPSDEELIALTTHRKQVEPLQLDSFVVVSGMLLDTLIVDEESTSPHGKYFFLLDSIKKTPKSYF